MQTLNRARRLYPFHVRDLEPASIVDLGACVTLPAGYHCANPSLVRYQDGYVGCVRGVNYVYRSPRSLAVDFVVGNTYHTLNRLVLLDDQLRPRRQLDALNAQLENLEDVRLFVHAGRLHGVATQPLGNGIGACRMCLLSFDAELRQVELRPIASPYGGSREKNWCPFSLGNELGFLYACSPEVFGRLPAGESKPVPLAGRRLPAKDSLRFYDCGSTPGQMLDGQYLFVTHRRSVRLPSLQRVYTSRLYLFSPDLQRVRKGPYFRMGAPTIEFVTGMCIGQDEVLLAYGVAERQALIARFERSAFFAQLPLR